MKLDEKLVSLRKEKGLSQLQLAEMMNVSRQAISRWEVGTAIPSTENLKYLGKLYGISVDNLLNEDQLPIHKEPQKTDTVRKEVLKKRTKARIIFILILIAGLIMYITFNKYKDETVSIRDLENDVTWRDSDSDEFSMTW